MMTPETDLEDILGEHRTSRDGAELEEISVEHRMSAADVVEADLIRLGVAHLVKGVGNVKGSLLITATTCIFDPDPGDPLIDLEPDQFQVVFLTRLIRSVVFLRQEAHHGTQAGLKMRMETSCFLPHEDGMYVLSYGQQVLLPVYTFSLSDDQSKIVEEFMNRLHPNILTARETEGELEVWSQQHATPKLLGNRTGTRSAEVTGDALGGQEVEVNYLEAQVVSTVIGRADTAWLASHLPVRLLSNRWKQIYSTHHQGFSLKSLYRKCSALEGPVLLVIQDTSQVTFGALLSEAPRLSETFYGTGECWLFSFKGNTRRMYPWSGDNSFFIQGSEDCLVIGSCEGRFGIWIDQD